MRYMEPDLAWKVFAVYAKNFKNVQLIENGLDKTSVLKIKSQLDEKYLQNETTRGGKYIVHDTVDIQCLFHNNLSK